MLDEQGDPVRAPQRHIVLWRFAGVLFFTYNLSFVGYRRHRHYKARGKRLIEYSTLDFAGILEVTDPERFQNTLFNGIGPAKGFGCGLLLVRRV